MRIWMRSIALAVWLFLPAIGGAEEAELRLTLPQALKLAAAHSELMQEVRGEVVAAKAAHRSAGAFANPSIELGAAGRQEELDYELGLSQEIELFGTRGLRLKLADNELEIKQLELAAARLELRLLVKQAFYRVLLAGRSMELVRDGLQMTRRFSDKVQLKHSLGQALKSELLRARLENYEAEEAVLRAEKELYVAKASLNLLLARTPGERLECIGELYVKQSGYSAKKLVARGKTERADLVALRLSHQSGKLALSLAKRELLGVPELGMSLGREEGERVVGGSLSLSIPLWYWKGGERAAAKNQIGLAEQRIAGLERRVELEINESLRELELSGRRLDLMKKSLTASNELLDYVSSRYSDGQVEYLVYLEALRKHKQVKQGYLTAQADYSLRFAELERAVGGEL